MQYRSATFRKLFGPLHYSRMDHKRKAETRMRRADMRKEREKERIKAATAAAAAAAATAAAVTAAAAKKEGL